MTTIADLLRGARNDSERRDLEVLIVHALDVGRAHLYAHGTDQLNDAQVGRIQALLRDCRSGTPVAYIVGRRAFWSLDLDVTRAVLIPRPETELLVELALERLPPRARVVDLGTGCGAIALAIKHERRDCTMVATDVSPAALEIARGNATRHGTNIELCLGDWYTAVNGTFDLIVSNPPYIRSDDPHLEALVSEPHLALAAGSDGLDALRCVIGGAPQYLTPGGWLLVEHGYDQGDQVRTLFTRAGFRTPRTVRDGAGHERVTLDSLDFQAKR